MLDALREDGQPEEAGWPYLPTTPKEGATWVPPENVGTLFRRKGGMISGKLGDIIGELDEGQPVIVLLQLSRSFYRPTLEGLVHPADGEVPDPERRHAVIAVGHGLAGEHRAILIRNSWGAKWGIGGYGWLTEPFLGPRLYAAAKLTEENVVSSSSFAA